MKIEITNQGKWHQSLTFKLGLLAFLGIVLLIPLQLIKEVIRERQATAEKVRKEIGSQWADTQYIEGPVLNIPVRVIPSGKDEKPTTMIWHIMPENLEITGSINPEKRYRGIYESVVYTSLLKLSGGFILPDIANEQKYQVLAGEAYLTVGISDNRGLKGDVAISTESGVLHAEPGVRDQEVNRSGITFSSPLRQGQKDLKFDLSLNLSGSEGLYFVPAGKTTKVHLQSDWKSPSFSGSFLPASRKVDDKGFSADWLITHLNRNFPQSWYGSSFNTKESSFGLDLFLPVDHYQKSWRSARYGILFIALSFLVLIFLEITRKEPIHIFHYFLVSLALLLFFSLLNALSEQTGFNTAYLISSVATIGMITAFTGALFRNRKTAFVVFGMLALLYAFIYILLTLNDYAYLAGNIGLFVLLAIVMALASRMTVFRSAEDGPGI
ncbi:MAG TPA: cell envelope integrity protein CreD [Bacteroidales bacterium]|nr:cell envelope integrity protein CreD [Bacteroidales bacterium]